MLVFSAATLVLVASPGPAVLFLVARTLEGGRARGMASLFGIALGELVHVAAAIVGISALIASSSAAFAILKYGGAAYLTWLGFRHIVARTKRAPEVRAVATTSRTFAQGFVVSVLNPKVALFFLSFLPQFVEPGRGPVAIQTAVLGVTYLVIAMSSDSIYVLGTSALRHRLDPRWQSHRAIRWVSGGVLVGLGISTALSAPHRFAGSAS